ncbi:hypothetical protein LBMAG53_31620 [Planctomycetota bacterium]|nr:hypothetical protein LBMAG53_31620 [Planctomycetota bacterium]
MNDETMPTSAMPQTKPTALSPTRAGIHFSRIRIVAFGLLPALVAAGEAGAEPAATTDGQTALSVRTRTEGLPHRPMVISNGDQRWDLWWEGRLTDSEGNRWDIGFLPGIWPSLQVAGRSWVRCGNYYTYAVPKDGIAQKILSSSWKDIGGTFLMDGVADDWKSADADISRSWRRKTFGWPAYCAWKATWGFVLKPLGRTVVGSLGVVGGSVAGGVCVAGGAVGATAISAGDVTSAGTVYPVARLIWQQPAWAVSVFTSEPEEEDNGTFTMRIIARPGSAQPETE